MRHGVEISSALVELEDDAKKRHQQLLELVTSQSDLITLSSVGMSDELHFALSHDFSDWEKFLECQVRISSCRGYVLNPLSQQLWFTVNAARLAENILRAGV
jgi:hypothetical protein